jgi:Domain of Unknown Function (DUF1080)/DinB superfamily
MRICIAALFAAAGVLSAQPQQLFNGKDLQDWKMVGPGRFSVENGQLKTEGGMGLLWYTGRMIGNETLRVVFRTTGPRDNSGVYIRLPEPPPDPWYGVHNGYEVQIDAAGDEWHMTGAIYSLSRAVKKAQKPTGEWNTMEIQMDGPLTRVTLNGEVVNEFRGDGPVPERKQWFEPVRGPRANYGFIGLQNHDADSTVYFKEVTVLPTDKSPLPISRNDRNRLLSYYHATRKQILDATTGLSPAQWKFKPAPEKWSVAEVVEHLALTEDFLFAIAANYLQHSAPQPAEVKLTGEQLVKNITDRSRPAQAPAELRPTGRWPSGVEVLNEFRTRRDHMIDWLDHTKEPLKNSWARWGGETITVYDALYTIPAHTERHLQQIIEVNQNPNFPRE